MSELEQDEAIALISLVEDTIDGSDEWGLGEDALTETLFYWQTIKERLQAQAYNSGCGNCSNKLSIYCHHCTRGTTVKDFYEIPLSSTGETS